MVVLDGVVLASFYNSMKIFGAICCEYEASATSSGFLTGRLILVLIYEQKEYTKSFAFLWNSS